MVEVDWVTLSFIAASVVFIVFFFSLGQKVPVSRSDSTGKEKRRRRNEISEVVNIQYMTEKEEDEIVSMQRFLNATSSQEIARTQIKEIEKEGRKQKKATPKSGWQ